jgi:hypothetical protein
MFCDVINKAKKKSLKVKIKSDTFKLVKSLKYIIRKGYDFQNVTTIVDYFRHVYFANNIDNMLV